jgi:N-terminal domain of anti-restriction factor ArdC
MTRLSPEEAAAQRKERRENLHAQLTEGVERLATSEGWTHYLDMASRLHRYSANNTLLILMQRPDATAVAGYKEWQKMGRQVRQGSKAIYILAPNKYKIETKNEETGEKDTAFALRGFRPAGVFAIEDTDGPELPKPALLTGEAPAVIWDGVTGLLQQAGYTVSREPIESRANGDTDPATKRVRVDSRLSPMQALKTLVHEWNHVSLGHVESIEEYRLHRGLQEVEAESATYVTMGALGFDTSVYSFDYITGWANGDPKLLMTTAERVITAAQGTVERLTPSTGLESPGVGIGIGA